MKPETLRRVHVGAALLHGALALTVLFVFLNLFPDRGAVPIFDTRPKDAAGPIYDVETRKVGEAPLPYLLAAFASITCAAHVLNALTRENVDGRGANRIRWAEYALSAPIMLVVIACLAGQRLLTPIVLLAVATAVTQFFGWRTEVRLAARDTRGAVAHQVAGWALYAPVWAAIAYTFFRHVEDARAGGAGGEGGEAEGPPAWIWAVLLSQFIFFSSFGGVQLAVVGGFLSQRRAEGVYAGLSFAAKATLIGLLVYGLTVADDADDAAA